jgi:hypothetical protein
MSDLSITDLLGRLLAFPDLPPELFGELFRPPRPESEVRDLLQRAIGETPSYLLEWFSLHDGVRFERYREFWMPMSWAFGAELLYGVEDSLRNIFWRGSPSTSFHRMVHLWGPDQGMGVFLHPDAGGVLTTGATGNLIAPSLQEYLRIWLDFRLDGRVPASFVGDETTIPNFQLLLEFQHNETTDEVGVFIPTGLIHAHWLYPGLDVDYIRTMDRSTNFDRQVALFRRFRPLTGPEPREWADIPADFVGERPVQGRPLMRFFYPDDPTSW